MAVDIRATVTCSLGTLISASINDDYIQETGLIKTKGSCEIKGVITPAPGTAVTFQYTKSGITRRVPKVLRVLSSFADPFRRTTKVELGCKLTYLQDLVDPIDWSVFDDPENAVFTEEESQIVTLPIRASSVMTKCLTELGITASSNPLTNAFSIGEFDFSPGYVNVLSDLLVSESYCGYLDENEVLRIINLSTVSSAGPLLTDAKIIDIGPIGVGQLAGEAVVVRYSTLRLKEPDQDPASPDQDPDSDISRARRWELTRTVSGPNLYTLGTIFYTGTEITETQTTYTRIRGSDYPQVRVTTVTGFTPKIAGSIGSAYVSNGIPFNATTTTLSRIIETNTYDSVGNITTTDTTTYRPLIEVFGSLSLPYVFGPGNFVDFSFELIASDRTSTIYDIVGGSQQTVQHNYKFWPFTIAGQQAVAEVRDLFQSAGGVAAFANQCLNAGLSHDSTSVTIQTANPGSLARPNNTISASYAEEDGDPDNNWRTEQEADIELVLGSPTAQRRIEFTLPYAPDDRFIKVVDVFRSIRSDAEQKANTYGRVQNRILLGNRSGMNVQTSPELVPVTPFSPFFISAAGTVALYRTNGTAWTMDSNGIVVSIDALYWGTAGQIA